jgi:hypothetical protein
VRFLALVAAGIAVAWLGEAAGLWWLTFVVGVAIGLAVRRSRTSLLASSLAGALGWGLPLAWLALFAPVGRAAAVVSGVFGVEGGALAIGLTVLLGVLLATTGAWLGSAARRLVQRSERPLASR